MKANGASGPKGPKNHFFLPPPPKPGTTRRGKNISSIGAISPYNHRIPFLSSPDGLRIQGLIDRVLSVVPEAEEELRGDIQFFFNLANIILYTQEGLEKNFDGTEINKREAAISIAEKLAAKGFPWEGILAALYSFIPIGEINRLSELNNIPEKTREILISRHRILSYPFGPTEKEKDWNNRFAQRQSDIFFQLLLRKERPEAVLLLGEEMRNFASCYQLEKKIAQKDREYFFKAWGPIADLLCFLNQEKESAQLKALIFPILFPSTVEALQKRIAEEIGWNLKDMADLLSNIERRIMQKLSVDLGIEKIEISSRVKELPKVWKRESRQQKGDSLYATEKGTRISFPDILGLRIVVEDRKTCLDVIQVIEQIFVEYGLRLGSNEINGNPQWKNYIESPKGLNQYRALHGLFSAGKLNIEVQIRAKEDHVRAEEGEAAHWRRNLVPLSLCLPFETKNPFEKWEKNRQKLEEDGKVIVGSEDGTWYIFEKRGRLNLLDLAFAKGFHVGMYLEHNAYAKMWGYRGDLNTKEVAVAARIEPRDTGTVYFFSVAGFPIASDTRKREANHIPAARWAYFLQQYLPDLFLASNLQNLQRYYRRGRQIYNSLRKQAINAAQDRMEIEISTFLEEGQIIASEISEEKALQELGFAEKEQVFLVLGALAEKVRGTCIAAEKQMELQEQIKKGLGKYILSLAYRKNKEGTILKILTTNRPGIFRETCRRLKERQIEINEAYGRQVEEGKYAMLTFILEDSGSFQISLKEDWRRDLLLNLLESPPAAETIDRPHKERALWNMDFLVEGDRSESCKQFFLLLDILSAQATNVALRPDSAQPQKQRISAKLMLPVYWPKNNRLNKARIEGQINRLFGAGLVVSGIQVSKEDQ